MDSELDSAAALEVEAHLGTCDGCRRLLESRQELSQAIKRSTTYAPAPERLRVQVRKRTSKKPRIRFGFASTAIAFGIGIALVTGLWQPWNAIPPLQNRILTDVVSHHSEALVCSHLTDIQSNDPKAVQAWFYKKFDYSPRVPVASEYGFKLAGARQDVIAGHTAPVLVYSSGSHHADVFVTPSGESDNFGADRDGLHILSWNNLGLGYWIVSDAPTSALVTLRQAFLGRRQR
jgi:anti-sigma factor RsiW